MAFTLVPIDTLRIADWGSFHDVFAKALGFPGFYGRNMNAWIDCMTDLDDPGTGMTTVHAPKGGVLVLQLEHMRDLGERCPELHAAIVECSTAVNQRRIEVGEEPALVLSFSK